jgi:hypothetical protein
MEWYLSALKGVKQINYFKHTGQATQSRYNSVHLYWSNPLFSLPLAARLLVLYIVCFEMKYLGREGEVNG